MTCRLSIAGLLFGLLFIAQPAAGLMCGTDQSMSPEQVVAARLVSGNQRYDLAMVARVTEVDRHRSSQTAQVEVFGVYGMASTPETAVVTFSGVEIAGGSIARLAEGSSYFIPVIRVGPQGEPNYANRCDPISEVENPEATALELAAIADAARLEFALPVPGDATGGPVTLVVVAALLFLLLWTFSRRRAGRDTLTGTGSDPRRPPGPRR